MTPRVACPYCNASVTLTEVPASRRVVCPRCGEGFPLTSDMAIEEGPRLPTESLNGMPEPVRESQPPSPGSFRTLALVMGVLVMLGTAAGLYYVLKTPPATVERDPEPKKQAATLPPMAVPALGYLPGETNIVFAVQPGPIGVYANRAGTDPRQFLISAGIPDRIFATLDQMGLRIEQIDQLAGGVVLSAVVELRAMLVLVLREELADEAAFLKGLKANRFTAPSGAVRYKVDLGGLPAEMHRKDGRTYLFSTSGTDLEAMAKSDRRGAEHLPTGLKQSLGKLSPASVVWLATDADRWAEKPAVTFAAGLLKQPQLTARLAGVQAAVIGVSLEPDPRLITALRGNDPATAQKWQANLPGATVAGDWVIRDAPFDPKQPTGLLNALPK